MMMGRLLDRGELRRGWELRGQKGLLWPKPQVALLAGDFGQKVGQLLIGQGRWPGPISALLKTWGCGLEKASGRQKKQGEE